MTYNLDRRSEIIALLSNERENAFTTKEICQRLLGEQGGKSTVYRIVSALVEDGVIKRISDRKSRHVKYQYLGEKVCTEHLHLKCSACGRLIHLDKSISESIVNSLKLSDGFYLDRSEFLIGKCHKCTR